MPGAAQVTAEHGAREAIVRVVREADGLVVVGRPEDWGDRAEDLLSRDGHVRAHAVEHARRHDEAAHGLTEPQPSPLALRLRDEPRDLVELFLVG